MTEMRIGLGVDLHPQEVGRPLYLGGVRFDGAAGLAGVVKLHERLAGRTVGTVLSGGNLPWHVLNRALNDIHSW